MKQLVKTVLYIQLCVKTHERRVLLTEYDYQVLRSAVLLWACR